MTLFDEYSPSSSSGLDGGIFSEQIFNLIAENLIDSLQRYGIEPNSRHLERQIYSAFRSVRENVFHFGSPDTFTDVKIDSLALDVKGRHIFHNTKTPHIPQTFNTPVRRPNVELEDFKGDSKSIVLEAVREYQDFALTTTKNDGCDTIFSFVCLYGILKSGFGCLYLSVQEMTWPVVVHADTKGKVYSGFDFNGKLIYKIEAFNRNSVNLRRVYQTPRNGMQYTFPLNNRQSTNRPLCTRDELEEKYGAIIESVTTI